MVARAERPDSGYDPPVSLFTRSSPADPSRPGPVDPSRPGPSHAPRLVFIDADGEIVEHDELEAVGVCGPEPARIALEDWIPVPRGSDFFLLPGRLPVAWSPEEEDVVVLEGEGLHAASTFLAPAWTRHHLPAYETMDEAPALPLHAHAVLGAADGLLWTTAVRVDPDERQDPWRFEDDEAIRRGAFGELDRDPENRVVQQLTRCALEYSCRAAQNFFLGRHEAPLPVSVACNAQCVGCISLQPDGEFRASHERLTRRVEPREIAAVALSHWERVPDGVVSFGQGCEGEPLLEDDALEEAIVMLRHRTSQGTINLNSNASRPDVVARLADAGLDAIRISLNSARPDVYAAYYNPRGYDFSDVECSAMEMKRRGRFISTNLLYFPGVTDTEAELDAFGSFCERVGVDVVQVRNLNIDPEIYARALPPGVIETGFGPARFMARLSERLPRLRYGYFNPTKERYAEVAG